MDLGKINEYIIYRFYRVAAAASPQLLQAAIRQHTPSTTDVVPLPLAGREVKLQKGGPLPPRWEACHRHEKEQIVSALFPYLLYPGPGQ